MASSVIISAPNAVLGIPRDVWGINSGVTEATDSTCSCTGWTFAHGDGVNKVFDLPSLVSSFSALYRRDWQGCVALSAGARTNRMIRSENSSYWVSDHSGTGVDCVLTAGYAIGPHGRSVFRAQFDRGAGSSISDISRLSSPSVSQAGLGSVGYWLRSTDGVSSYQMRINIAGAGSNTVTVDGTWRYLGTSYSGTGSYNGRIELVGSIGSSPTADILIAGGQHELGVSAVTAYIGPTTTTPVTVTDYAATGNTITLAEAPLLGSDLSVDADLVPHTCLSFNHGGRR